MHHQGQWGLRLDHGPRQGPDEQTHLDCPKLIRFTELTEDEVYCTETAAQAGVVFENTSPVEPLVALRYFGPDVNPEAPELGAYRRIRLIANLFLTKGRCFHG